LDVVQVDFSDILKYERTKKLDSLSG